MDIIDLYTTKCTCLTKTPDTKYHKECCDYRVVWERFYCEQEDLPPDMQKVLNERAWDYYLTDNYLCDCEKNYGGACKYPEKYRDGGCK